MIVDAVEVRVTEAVTDEQEWRRRQVHSQLIAQEGMERLELCIVASGHDQSVAMVHRAMKLSDLASACPVGPIPGVLFCSDAFELSPFP